MPGISYIYLLHFIVNIHVTSNRQGKNEKLEKRKEGKDKNRQKTDMDYIDRVLYIDRR
jgi:hypothetical protein